jgi:hypothetical protein
MSALFRSTALFNRSIRASSIAALYPYLLFGVTIIVFFWPLRKAGFIIDDPQYIWFSAKNSLLKIFFDPLTYMYLSPANFTPFLAFTFKIDSYFFKGNPLGYNIHSFISLFSTSCMLYILLRNYSSKVVAICGVMFFIICPSTAEITSWLSTRHYLEGMFWALLSLHFMQRRDDSRNSLNFFLVASPYLIAALYKEVYVPLPAVAFLLTGGNFRRRFFKTLPLWIGLFLYIPYRLYMLGGNVGGYPASVFSFGDIAHNVIMISQAFPKMIFGQYWFIALLLCVTLIILLMVRKKHIPWVGILASYIVILIPIATLSIQTISFRYLFHLTTFIIILVAIGWHYLSEKKMIFKVPMILMILGTFFIWTNTSIGVRNTYKQYRDQTMADVVALIQNRDKPFIVSRAPEICDLNWYFDGVKKMYRLFEGLDLKAKILFPNYMKYNPPEMIQEVFDSGAGNDDRVKEFVPGDFHFNSTDLQKGPLSIDVSTNGYAFSWKFGPEEGPYTVMVRRKNEFYFPYKSIPRKGRYLFAPGFANVLYFRVLYQKPGGIEVISPEFELDFPSKITQRMQWE